MKILYSAASVAVIAAVGLYAWQTFSNGQSSALGDSQFSIFDLVNECDLLAAHPEDPQRMADGVADDEIVPRLAIMACEDAIADDPEEPRFAFQLGRALLAVKREKEAIPHLEAAAKEDYSAAHAYLGDVYQFGLGASADPTVAMIYYQKAIAGKFEVAKSQVEQLTFDSKQYVSGSIGAFYNKDFQRIRSGSDLLLRNYVFNFVSSTMEECGSFLTPINLVNFYLYRYPPGKFSFEQEENINVAIQTEVGEHDAELFIEKHGCEGPVAKQLFANMNEFFSE